MAGAPLAKTPSGASVSKLTPGKAQTMSKASGSPLASAALEVKKDKERRRQSWNDFVIPQNVLEKQKGLKENMSAVKKFAGGIGCESKIILVVGHH